ncbi:hypothetical protein OS175_01350 [Marinicella sp. S1101]|nr:hypothetical protein [Marinicella marina]MCX7552507.1 hypothetical protein [Marinicella marina]MDJ1139383.1 hypothetical protein [Marinicella marina]
MKKVLLMITFCLGFDVQAQLNIDAKVAAIQYNQISSAEFSQLMNAFEFYIDDYRDMFHDD